MAPGTGMGVIALTNEAVPLVAVCAFTPTPPGKTGANAVGRFRPGENKGAGVLAVNPGPPKHTHTCVRPQHPTLPPGSPFGPAKSARVRSQPMPIHQKTFHTSNDHTCAGINRN